MGKLGGVISLTEFVGNNQGPINDIFSSAISNNCIRKFAFY